VLFPISFPYFLDTSTESSEFPCRFRSDGPFFYFEPSIPPSSCLVADWWRRRSFPGGPSFECILGASHLLFFFPPPSSNKYRLSPQCPPSRWHHAKCLHQAPSCVGEPLPPATLSTTHLISFRPRSLPLSLVIGVSLPNPKQYTP